MAQSALDNPGQVLPLTEETLVPEDKKAHLLLVDDNPQIVELCRLFLANVAPPESAGVETEIHTAASGEEALAIVEGLLRDGHRIACAVVDVMMPDGIDGIETISRIWEIDADVQCTLVTGAGKCIEPEIEARLAPQYLDRWDLLSKPFTHFEIVQGVRRSLVTWLSHRREERRGDENMKLLLQLSQSNKQLEKTVEERTRALAERLRELESAQSKLVEQEKMACIGQLAAGVAHELNNPIGFVHSNLGTLVRYFEKIRAMVDAYEQRVADGDEELDAIKRQHKFDFVLEDLPALIEESLEGTERMRKIVSDLKVFSHPDEHSAKYADLNEGLQSTLNIVHNEIKYKAKVTTELGDIPPVLCMAGQINQVFMNLLVNAGQAVVERGEIRLATCRDGDVVVITVSDTGCGIPADALPRIFDPFFTTKDVGQGTGLGLSISYDIVRKHGGTLSVETEEGQGTCFTIRLPIDGGDLQSG